MAVVMMVFALDQLSKAWARAALDPSSAVSLVPLVDLSLRQNRGVAFGMFASDDPRFGVVITLLTAIIIGFVFSWLWRERRWMIARPLALIAGGALGNLFDRLRHQAVTDFLDFHVAGWHWPAFNLADVAIVSGFGFLLLRLAGRERDEMQE